MARTKAQRVTRVRAQYGTRVRAQNGTRVRAQSGTRVRAQETPCWNRHRNTLFPTSELWGVRIPPGTSLPLAQHGVGGWVGSREGAGAGLSPLFMGRPWALSLGQGLFLEVGSSPSGQCPASGLTVTLVSSPAPQVCGAGCSKALSAALGRGGQCQPEEALFQLACAESLSLNGRAPSL